MDKTSSLPPAILQIVQNKGTEPPFSGTHAPLQEAGTYLCRRCGLALFRTDAQFHSGCGWPSFDQTIPKTVTQQPDADGIRTELLCARCQAHLGHLFEGEGFTARNLRHCVNTLSLDFVAHAQVLDTEEAIFGGVEYFLKQRSGVLKTEVGYCGGPLKHPTYEQVCSGQTGHVEAVRVVYDPDTLRFTELVQYFFENHDPTQTDGQGPDIGPQYASVIFYYDDSQRETAAALKNTLIQKGAPVVTQILPVRPFWPAEDYHQDYCRKHGQTPYCHRSVRQF